jgi:hypothetical protein
MREGMSVTARPALDVHAPSAARPVVSRAAAAGPALSLDDLFADRPTTPNGRPAPAPVARPFVRPRSARLLVFARGDVLWSADPTVEMPHPTPSDIGDLVVLMGLIRPSARGSVVAELLRCNPAELARLVQDHRPGGPPLVGRGLCLAAQLLRRREWEPAVRSLLADPDALARSFVKQVLMYATGTDIHYSDRLAIERIVVASREHGHGLRSLFHEIAASQLFRGK